MSLCTIKYEIGRGREHLATISYKGMTLEAGKTYDVTPEYAGMAKAGLEGVTVVSGEPAAYTPVSPSTRKAVRLAREEAEANPGRDAAKQLDALPEIPAELLRKLRAKEADACKVIDEGAADACLGAVGVWARLGGLADLARTAARRAEALRLKG